MNTKWRVSNNSSVLPYSGIMQVFIIFLKKVGATGDLRVIRIARIELICVSEENSDIFT